MGQLRCGTYKLGAQLQSYKNQSVFIPYHFPRTETTFVLPVTVGTFGFGISPIEAIQLSKDTGIRYGPLFFPLTEDALPLGVMMVQ
jgi:hypothetical protein